MKHYTRIIGSIHSTRRIAPASPCGNRYRHLLRDLDGGLPVPVPGLRLALWPGTYIGIDATRLRWADADGLLPLPEEGAARQAEAAEQRARRTGGRGRSAGAGRR